MENDNLPHLEALYAKLRKTMTEKLENDSVFLTLIRKDNNPVLRILNDAAVRSSEIPHLVLQDLKDKGYIQDGVVESTYLITARGLWEIEKEKGLLSEHQLVDYFQQKKFDNRYVDARLNDLEKILVFSMIAARAFSAESCVDLLGERHESVIKGWEQIIISSADFLSGTNIVNIPKQRVLVKKGNEHPVNFLFQHTDKLPKKTRFYYKALGRQRKYFLDVSERGNISTSKLSNLLVQIFEKKMKYENIQITVDFCRRTAYDFSVAVFEAGLQDFADPDCDRIVEEAITKAILGI